MYKLLSPFYKCPFLLINVIYSVSGYFVSYMSFNTAVPGGWNHFTAVSPQTLWYKVIVLPDLMFCHCECYGACCILYIEFSHLTLMTIYVIIHLRLRHLYTCGKEKSEFIYHNKGIKKFQNQVDRKPTTQPFVLRTVGRTHIVIILMVIKAVHQMTSSTTFSPAIP